METGTQDPFRTTGASGTSEEKAREKAGELTRTARERAMSTLDEQKSQLSSVLERVADTLEDDRLGAYASPYARRGAELLRRQSADEIFRSVRRELRSRPGLVLAASFAAGLAFARFAKGAAGEGGSAGDGRWEGDGGYGEGRIGWREGES